MSTGVTLAAIAQTLGVHHSTVSRALRRDPQLPPATWEKVQTVARELGYEPNAHARAMAFRRRVTRPVSEHGAIGILARQERHKDIPRTQLANYCREFGYQAEVFYYETSELSADRLTRILKAQGIAGLLIIPPRSKIREPKRLKLDWSPFPAVVMGHSLFWPPLHRVADNQFRNIRYLIRKLHSLGYRRIGLFAEAELIRDPDNGWLGGYLAETQLRRQPSRILLRERDAYDPPTIRNWIKSEKLEAVITDHEYAAARIAELGNRTVPEELGIASLYTGREGFSGIDSRFAQIERSSVEYLVHLIHSHQRGIPEFPQRVLLEGTWFEGNSTRRIN